MARTALTVTTTAAAGTVLPAAAAVDQANGNQFTNTGRELIEITNGAGSPVTVTFTTNGVYSVGSVQYPIADLAVTVTNGTSKVCGPFDKVLFNDGSNNVDVDYSSGTSITARVISLGAG
jgi:hypothetical protein